MFNVSLNLARDWENVSADQTLLSIFDTVEMDCYAHTSENGEKCWLIRGTSSDIYCFVARLHKIVRTSDIIDLDFTRSSQLVAKRHCAWSSCSKLFEPVLEQTVYQKIYCPTCAERMQRSYPLRQGKWGN